MLSVQLKTSPLQQQVCRSPQTGSQALASSICMPGTRPAQASPGCTGVACTTAAIRSTSFPGLSPCSCSTVVHLRGLKAQRRGPASASSCCCHLVWRVVHNSSCLQQAWYWVGSLSAAPAHQPRSLKECSCWQGSAQSCLWRPACRALPTGPPFCTKSAALSPQGPLPVSTTTHGLCKALFLRTCPVMP